MTRARVAPLLRADSQPVAADENAVATAVRAVRQCVRAWRRRGSTNETAVDVVGVAIRACATAIEALAAAMAAVYAASQWRRRRRGARVDNAWYLGRRHNIATGTAFSRLFRATQERREPQSAESLRVLQWRVAASRSG